jgi:3-oxoacyl-[acyl-carrier protein] reductase
MDLGVQDKVALVTGASQGLGFASAMALAAEGARLAICSRSRGNLDRAAAAIEEGTGRKPYTVVADMTRADNIRGLVAQTAEDLGGLQIVVNNTGGPPPGGFDDISDADWAQAFRLTALSTIRLLREAIPHMKEAGFGRIVNIQSRSVREPVDGLITSNALRPGVIGLAKTLSRELGPSGITVNSVLPGFIRTERLRELATVMGEKEERSADEIFAAWSTENPVGRIGEPEEVGALVAFLASERAAFINGVSILIDGGGVRTIF